MIKRECLVVLCLSLFFCAGILYILTPVVAAGSDSYFTKVNIWYEEPSKIFATNYHKGAIIPVGTEVSNVKIGAKSISFTAQGFDGISFSIINVPKHTLTTTKQIFDNYFTKEDIKSKLGIFSKFSIHEKKNIEKGEISANMSKEAVIMSYGYPPKHKTADLNSNNWYYWLNRFVAIQVVFKNNKIASIEHNVKVGR